MCVMKKTGLESAVRLFHDFLHEQEHACRMLKTHFPDEKVDLYQDHLNDLFANLNVLMYYQITPNQLEVLLKLNKAHRNFDLLEETNLDLDSCGRIVENLLILLYKQGQLNTFVEGKPVDQNNAPIPWITYPALEFLSQFDYSECSIFEFGAGNSTLFWAKRARKVVSVETDKGWFESLSRVMPSNVDLFHIEEAKGFTESILRQNGTFEVIVIDSLKHRYGATKNAIKKMTPGGILIFDNSDWYPNSCRVLRDAGLFQIDFHGFGPVNGYAWTTSIFFEDGIRLKRIKEGVHPVGGISNQLEDDGPSSDNA